MAKASMLCPFSKGPCVECAIYRGRHYYLCYAREYRGHLPSGKKTLSRSDGGKGFVEIDKVIEAWETRNSRLDGTVTSGTAVTIRSNLRFRDGIARPRIELEEAADLGTLIRSLRDLLDFPIFDGRDGVLDHAVLVALNGKPYSSLERNLGTPLTRGDVVEINLALVAGG